MVTELGTRTSDPVESPTDVATRIAAEVRHGQARDETKVAKVTSLLHAFRTTGSPAGFRGVVSDLRAQGLNVNSAWGLDEAGWPNCRPTGVLEFSCINEELRGKGDSDPGLDETIQVSVWRPGSGPSEERPLSPGEGYVTDAVVWYNVDPPANGSEAASPDVFETRVVAVAGKLKSCCPGLDDRMVRDLLTQDVQPKVETYGDENDGVRGISVLAVIAREAPGEPGDSDGISEELIFQMVEIIVGERWIITCWHPTRTFIGTDEPEAGHSVLREPFLSHVRHRWREADTEASLTQKTSSDLAVYLSRTLVDTYEASHRMLERWVANWEVDFYRSLSSEKKAEHLKEAAREISNLLSMVGEFRRRLTAFEHARYATTDRTWFPSVSDHGRTSEDGKDTSQQGHLATHVLASEKSFALLSDTIRADINLLMLQSTASQQESAEKLQRLLGILTGLILVPTLVAGLFGANTQLPGRETWLGFDLMMVLIVVTAGAAYLLIRRFTR